jgi:ABC-type multidrug transport system permease subunit
MNDRAADPVGDLTDGRVLTRRDAFVALCIARFREFYRESEVVFWNFVFPLILAFGLGIAFRDRAPEALPVAVVAGPGGDAVAAALARAPLLKVTTVSEDAAAHLLRMGKAALVIVALPSGVSYRFDPSRPDATLARSRVDDALQRAAGRADPLPSRDESLSEPGGRYIDFLIPGILGMNLMSGGMWGVAFNLVDMRIKRLLKRYLATPMRRVDFMAAQMSVRLGSMVLEASFLLVIGRLFFGVPLRGSLAAVFAVGGVGALAFGGMGLLLASRATRIEGVMGLMNAVMMPMFVCSGTFFSWERFPEAVHPLIRALPLTALNDALRAVILEGATLASQAIPLAIVAAWGLAGFVLGLRFFRWN